MIDAHQQTVTHRYILSYPDHSPRAEDPHYRAFVAWKKANVPDTSDLTQCYVAAHHGTADGCNGVIEVHHGVIEFAVMNAVELASLEVDYPGITDELKLNLFVESGKNFMLLCSVHHRGAGKGIHSLSYADWTSALYAPALTEAQHE